ncbi:hypothetical protein D915_006774 [Fasciola hepatica]|uniref:Uncharacterized protein n=1 Tax=Fasciola hepatica TaxID=6192 RepID=A0A4E0R8V6_FASHE|nr:hypothetical protein D915_006774 [Fasciola hepatica]
MLVPDWMKSLAVLPILCVFTPIVFVLAALCASSSGRSLYYYRQAIRGHEDEVETEVTGKFSTLGVHIISKMYFTTGMFITSVLLLLNYLFWFATRADIVRRLHLSDTSLPKMQTCSMWMACTSAVALNILAAYSENYLHRVNSPLATVIGYAMKLRIENRAFDQSS